MHSTVLIGSFSFMAEKSELRHSSSEQLCLDVCRHFEKLGLICEQTAVSLPEGGGMGVGGAQG